MGAHSCELFCNIGMCCLYGGQLDLVFPCFQRAIRLATTPEQRADVWYNLSFVALVCNFYSFFDSFVRLFFGTIMPWRKNYIVIQLIVLSIFVVLVCIFSYFFPLGQLRQKIIE